MKVTPFQPTAYEMPTPKTVVSRSSMFSLPASAPDRVDFRSSRIAPRPLFGNSDSQSAGATSAPGFAPRNIGDSARNTVIITRQMVQTYANLVNDLNPIHVDEDTGKASIFGRNIAHGMLVGGLFGPIVVNQLIGPGAVYLKQTLEFKAPVPVDETVTAEVTVQNVKRKPDKDIYTLQTQVLLPSGKPAIIGEAVILKPADSPLSA
jgi:3-hydroxybutyryl-CoA dehydratase